MSCIGIDLGNLFCPVAQAKHRGIDLLLNESSNRLNRNLVSFQGNERFLCEAAVPMERSNIKNTVSDVKRLIGRKFSEPSVQKDIEQFIAYPVVAMENDEIGIKVNYDGKETIFTPQQIVAMVLTKLKGLATTANPRAVNADVVLSVPCYFTDRQRRAMLDAAHIADLNVLRLLNEPTAAALAYGIYKSAKGEFSDTEPRNIMFVDMGHTQFTVSVVQFLTGKLSVLAAVSDPSIGGRDLDAAIARKLANDFKAKFGSDPWENRKARLKLLKAAEKAKKTLSPHGVAETSVYVECVYQDRDLSTKLTLEDFDAICAPLMEKLRAPIAQALGIANLEAKQLQSVEIVGGSMRVRCVKATVADALNIKGDSASGYGLSTTLNMDECIARGCALQCAILSPTFRVKEFEIHDVVSYPIRVSWDQQAGAGAGATTDDAAATADAEDGAVTDNNSVLLFSQGAKVPYSRRITFRRASAFSVTADYEESKEGMALPAGQPRSLGRYQVSGMPADAIPADGSAPKVRVVFSVDLHGIFSVTGAQVFKTIEEEVVAPPPAPAAAAAADGEAKDAAAAPADADAAADAGAKDVPMDGTDGAATAEAPATATAEAPAQPATKKKHIKVDLVVNSTVDAFTAQQRMEAHEAECKMAQQDRIIRETQGKRNELESYIYDTRNALPDFSNYITGTDMEHLSSQLDTIEEWLYDEGFDVAKKVYQAKLDDLRKLGEPMRRRKLEEENRPAAVSAFFAVIEQYKRVAATTKEPYAHLEDEDRNVLRTACSEAEAWITEQLSQQGALASNVDPVLTISDIREKQNALNATCKPVANKPVPKPKEEEEEKTDEKKDAKKEEKKKTDAKKEAEEGKAKDGAAAEEDDVDMGGDGAGTGAGAGAEDVE